MSPLEMMKTHYDAMTKAEQKAADYILQEPQCVLGYPLTTLAQLAGTSNAALIRMCQKIGFDGFSEFKFSMNRYLLSHGAQSETPERSSTQELLDTYVRYINQLPEAVPAETLQELARRILAANRLELWGINRTGQSAQQMSNRLGRLGIYSKVTDDWIVMGDDSEILGKGDVCFLFSLNGRGSTSYGQLLASLRARGCYVVLVTMNPRLKLAAQADTVVTLPWLSHEAKANFFEDQVIVYLFIELLLAEVVNQSPLLRHSPNPQRPSV